MRKLLFFLLLAIMSCAYGYAKAIYFPMYYIEIEEWRNDTLYNKRQIINHQDYTFPSSLTNCDFVIRTDTNIVSMIQESINRRQAANLAAISSVVSSVGAVASSYSAITSNSRILSSFYVANSYFFLTNAWNSITFMEYYKDISNNALIIPTGVYIKNNNDNKLYNSYDIVKPQTTLELSRRGADEWCIKDMDGIIYFIRIFAVICRDQGIMSREKHVAYVDLNEKDKNTLIDGEKPTSDMIKRIDLNTYEMDIISKKDKEYLDIKKEYSWDNGYNEKQSY